ncbi:hypothetical protein N431DRAFT_471089 [Stipitochalara longipes BDJ]|nr:hypothetical protein N431DRAFT_471089 [Stipitochalara longipes BDJ]
MDPHLRIEEATSEFRIQGTDSALIGSAPATLKDYYIAKFILLAFGKNTDSVLGASIPPLRPSEYVFETRGPRIIASMSAAIAVMIIVTGLRLGVRWFRRGLVVGWDDVFIGCVLLLLSERQQLMLSLVALQSDICQLLAIAWPILQICAVIYGGAGKHMYDVTYEDWIHQSLHLLLQSAANIPSIPSMEHFQQRLPILALCLRQTCAFVEHLQCDPPYTGWNAIRTAQRGKPFHCTSDTIVGSALSVIHVVMDFGLLSVPLIVLWKIRMDLLTKLRLYFVFSIASVSVVGSILRQTEQGKLSSNDILYKFVALQHWTLVDLTFGVVAASLPILSAFIPKKWKTVDGSTNPTTAGQLPYIRSTRRTSISGKREASESEENIMKTDVIELSFETRSQYLWESNHQTVLSNSSIRSINEAGENDNEFVMGLGQGPHRERDEIFPITDHRTWVEHGNDRLRFH